MPVQIYCRKNNPVRVGALKRCLDKLLSHLKMEHAFLEISLVGLKKMAHLNKTHLKKKAVTDVLSFPLDEKPINPHAPWQLGEIVIATEIAKRQAKRSGRKLNSQIVRLVVHGLVHLQGLDHEREGREKERFEALENKYLKYLQKIGLLQWDGSLLF